MNTAQIAIGAIVVIVLAEHLAIWSLFFRRGWKVSVPPVPKPATTVPAGEAERLEPRPDSPAALIEQGRSAA